MTPNGKAWSGLVPALVVPAAATLVVVHVLPGTPAGKALYAGLKLFTLAWPAFAVLALERRRMPWAGPRAAARALPLGLAAGLALGGGVAALYLATPLGPYVRTFAPIVRTRVTELGIREHYVAFASFLALAHSLIEEYYWRGYVFGRMAELWRPVPAGALAAVAFAAHHYAILGSFFPAADTIAFGTCVGLGGAFWSWLCRRQGTIAGAWLSHACVDAAILGVGYDLVFGCA